MCRKGGGVSFFLFTFSQSWCIYGLYRLHREMRRLDLWYAYSTGAVDGEPPARHRAQERTKLDGGGNGMGKRGWREGGRGRAASSFDNLFNTHTHIQSLWFSCCIFDRYARRELTKWRKKFARQSLAQARDFSLFNGRIAHWASSDAR